MRNCFVLVFAFLCIFCTNKKESLSKKVILKTVVSYKVISKPRNTYDTIVTNEFYHDELSRSFDIKVLVNRYRNLKEQHDSCVAKFTIYEKPTKRITDTFRITSNFYYAVFEDKNHVRSYSTGLNAKKQILDNDYGDIVVADLNFDKKEDIAITNDYGGNGGAFYNFYLQEQKNKFKLDRFLTDSVVYFPGEIKNKMLTTYIPSGTTHMGRHIYILDNKKKEWSEKSHVLIDVSGKVVKKSE